MNSPVEIPGEESVSLPVENTGVSHNSNAENPVASAPVETTGASHNGNEENPIASDTQAAADEERVRERATGPASERRTTQEEERADEARPMRTSKPPIRYGFDEYVQTSR